MMSPVRSDPSSSSTTTTTTNRRSVSGSRDSAGSGSESSVIVKRRSPITTVRSSPTRNSGFGSSRESSIRNPIQRPRSANLSGLSDPPLTKSRHPTRAGSLSPSSTNRFLDQTNYFNLIRFSFTIICILWGGCGWVTSGIPPK